MTDLIANFIEDIVKYADSVGRDRDELVAEIAALFVMTIEACTFKHYEFEED